MHLDTGKTIEKSKIPSWRQPPVTSGPFAIGACGNYVVPSGVTGDPDKVQCGACKRTRAYRNGS